MNIIYSKITENRKDEYKINTLITRINNDLFVLKKGLFNNDHVLNILSAYKKLNNAIPMQKCESYGDYIKLDYITGTSLEEMLLSGDEDKGLDLYSKIIDAYPKCEFKPNDKFIEIFGDVKYFGEALDYANLDISLSNIIVSDDKPVLIDYEWTFDFNAPLGFIVFRALNDFNIHHPNRINLEKWLTKFKVDDVNLFKAMNESFDRYVSNETDYRSLNQKEEHYVGEHIDDFGLEIERLNNRIAELGAWGNKSQDEIRDRDLKIEQNMKELEKKNSEINKLEKNVSSLNNEKSNLNSQINDLKESNNNLQNKVNEFENSTVHRMAKKYYKVRDFFFPPNSKRKFFMKMLVRAIKHPIWFIKHASPKNMKKVVKYSKTEGLDRVLERVEIYRENNAAPVNMENLEIFNMNKRDTYPVLSLPKFKKPDVSIIIPVYNQFSYTYGCIESIIKNSEGISYEVIIGDDCSTDETKEISKYIENIIVSKNKKNVRFLLNCKYAAKKASGKYILFLNNDTNVQKDWLSSLIETIESDEKIGMVGSKLVYPNGMLQEAGGILWRDASAWNFGNKSDRNASEFNYRKPADYISGAAIMVKASVWNLLGGFDELFVPAYCEDSDFAFMVRQAGYEVIYDPKSVVIHYEGISNGTDVTQGVKKYQVDNQARFFKKWGNTLKAHAENGVDVFLARDRSYAKKHILFIDHYVPQFDKDAGSRTVYNYLLLLADLGYQITFLGENFYQSEPYTTILQKRGIEVLYGPYYANNWQNWLSINGKYFDFVFMNRPHITKKFIDEVKKHCNNAKYIYYGHDLHYLRVLREYELTKKDSLLNESNDWKKTEFDIYDKVDLIYYPSQIEVDEIKKVKDYNAKVLQPYMFNNIKTKKYDPVNRTGILFVGGFRHSPNFDGIMWFVKEIFPKILKKNKDIVLSIAGSYPPDELKQMQNKNIKVLGFVSDDELAKLYEETRLVVVPLRYGAGIKGKVIEAMANGLPVITTACGAEGIETNALVIDEDFKSLVDVYNNQAKLKKMSKDSIEYIRLEYSYESAKRKLDLDFKELEMK